MNELIKVHNLNGDLRKDIEGKETILMSKYITDVTVNENEVFELHTSLNGLLLMLDYKGSMIGIDLDKFIREILINGDKYIDAAIENLKKKVEEI